MTVPFIANGGITSLEDADELMKQTHSDAVMSGSTFYSPSLLHIFIHSFFPSFTFHIFLFIHLNNNFFAVGLRSNPLLFSSDSTSASTLTFFSNFSQQKSAFTPYPLISSSPSLPLSIPSQIHPLQNPSSPLFNATIEFITTSYLTNYSLPLVRDNTLHFHQALFVFPTFLLYNSP